MPNNFKKIMLIFHLYKTIINNYKKINNNSDWLSIKILKRMRKINKKLM